jgi:hypothetical protein
MSELVEFRQIVDGEWPDGSVHGKKPTDEELTRAAQALMTRQCIYSSTPSLGRTYEILRAYSSFFERYFSVLGYRLVVMPRDQMVALSVPLGEARYDSIYERLRKDETIVLLGLRLLWEESISNQNVGEGGVVETTTGELIDKIRAVTQGEPPEEARLLDILRIFQRHGVARTGVRDRLEKMSPLSILPGVSVVVPDGYLEDLMQYAASGTPEIQESKAS